MKSFYVLTVSAFLLNANVALANSNKDYEYDGDETPVVIPKPHKCPPRIVGQPVSTTYNSSTTQLNVAFSVRQGGKVEIYHNGIKVVDASATAGASLSYMLRNYGKGNYTIIVSCGNNVVYNNNVVIKN